jgi:hypothetical protein
MTHRAMQHLVACGYISYTRPGVWQVHIPFISS